MNNKMIHNREIVVVMGDRIGKNLMSKCNVVIKNLHPDIT